MRLYQRKGVWYIDYSFNGRRVRKKVGTSEKMAQLALNEIELKIAKGEFLGVVETRKVLFEELCEEYLAFSKANKTAQSYRRDTVSISRLLHVFGGTMISKIMAYDLERYKNMRRDEVSPATVNREISCIKHMFTKAQHWNLVMKNQLHSVAKFKEPPGRVRYLSEDEIDRLLYCCPEYLKAIVITALNRGMRKKEILDLQWPDVDLIKRIIRVRDSKNHQARIIPINDVLYALLLKLPRNRKSNDNVFLGKHGMPVRSFQNAWDRALRNAGIADFRFHDLRHTFASHLAMRGVNIRDLQELLGHKTILMTMRYSHLSDDILRQAVDRLNLCERNVTEVAQGPFRKVRVSAKRCKH